MYSLLISIMAIISEARSLSLSEFLCPFKTFDSWSLRLILNFHATLIRNLALIHDQDKMLKVKYTKHFLIVSRPR